MPKKKTDPDLIRKPENELEQLAAREFEQLVPGIRLASIAVQDRDAAAKQVLALRQEMHEYVREHSTRLAKAKQAEEDGWGRVGTFAPAVAAAHALAQHFPDLVPLVATEVDTTNVCYRTPVAVAQQSRPAEPADV